MQQTSDGLAIDLQEVAKVYKGRVHALQGIEMRVARGEIFGLLGPNGAGKSTLVKIMMTVIRPTRAVGTLLGNPVGHKATLRKVGYLPENHRFPKYLTGRQTLEFFGALSDVDRATRKKRAEELLEIVGMTPWADKKVSTYSKGMMQRVGIGQALMGDPDLVVLDEPTDGVDPAGRLEIRRVLAHIRGQGKTVFVNSHLLSELEVICDRVAILVQGRVAKQGTIDELTRKSERYEIELEVAPADMRGLGERIGAALGINFKAGLKKSSPTGRSTPPPMPGVPTLAYLPAPVSLPGPAPLPLLSAASLQGTLDDGTWLELDGAILSVGTSEAARVQPMLDALRRDGLTVRRMMPVRQNLEDLFMEAVINPATGQLYGPGAQRGRP